MDKTKQLEDVTDLQFKTVRHFYYFLTFYTLNGLKRF